MERTENCVETRETCLVEDGAGVVIRTINNTCCGEQGDEGGHQMDTGPVQWYNFLHIANESYLDLSSDGEVLLSEGGQDVDSQKWRFHNGEVLNKETQGKALGVDATGKLSMVDEGSASVLTSIVFENGNFQLEDASFHVQVADNGDIGWSHNVAKRNADSVDSSRADVGQFKMLMAGNVECPELDGVIFRPFQEMTPNTQCWDDNEPVFRLFHGSDSFIIANDKEHLKTIVQPHFLIAKIPKLVVLIHGYRANADSWPKDMAKILTDLGNQDLYVLTVDWEEGAETNWSLHVTWWSFPYAVPKYPYTTAAANTRCDSVELK